MVAGYDLACEICHEIPQQRRKRGTDVEHERHELVHTIVISPAG